MPKNLNIGLVGKVQRYKGNGRKLGYPTANISTPTGLTDGVYFGYASLSEYIRQPALVFIGVPTTVGDKERRVEAHLLDIPDIDYYGLDLTIDLRYYYRPNKDLGSIDELIAIIGNDEIAARKWFKQNA